MTIPVSLQLDDRLPDRLTTHIKPFGDVVVGNPVAFTQHTFENQGANIFRRHTRRTWRHHPRRAPEEAQL